MTTVLVASGELGSAGGLRDEFAAFDDVTVEFRQTDDEAELISWLLTAVDSGWGVVLDPTAFTHYSFALRDAAALVTGAGLPLIEVHLTNPTSRDEFRQASVIAAVATGVIAGLGLDSYRFAVQAAARLVEARPARAAARA